MQKKNNLKFASFSNSVKENGGTFFIVVVVVVAVITVGRMSLL